ncbi:MAG TPA: hypothetical protein DCP91_10690, partial [Eggerthellaceae bacterium]|nr:hypothetical protein [Eggerthellaceae bacterium]
MGAKSISQKVFYVLAILAMAFAVSLLWGGAQAHAVPYVERHWDSSQARVVSETKDCASYSTITDSTTTISGWYVVSGDSSFKDYRLVVEGEAHIILCDGAKLYLEEGINVSSGNRLFIYGQAGDSGQLHCDADTN